MKTKKAKPDKYDKAITYLTKHPEAIYTAWIYPYSTPGGCLFTLCASTETGRITCGCLTQIRGDGMLAETQSLTEAIQSDRRIPRKPDLITVEHLPVFAEWQRRLDKELKRDAKK